MELQYIYINIYIPTYIIYIYIYIYIREIYIYIYIYKHVNNFTTHSRTLTYTSIAVFKQNSVVKGESKFTHSTPLHNSVLFYYRNNISSTLPLHSDQNFKCSLE